MIQSIAYGSAQPNISSRDIESIKNVTPPNQLLEMFNELVSPLFHKILNNFKENNNLIDLRKILLPQLISGKFEKTFNNVTKSKNENYVNN